MAFPGSGVGTRIGFDAEFSQDKSILTFLAAGQGGLDPANLQYDQLRLELESKTISRSKLLEEETNSHSTKEHNEVPVYLRETYQSFAENHWHEHRLALALIQQVGNYQYPVPTGWDQTRVGYSRDGKRFLLNPLKGDETSWFFYGDLERRIVKKVATPKELYRMALEIYPIP